MCFNLTPYHLAFGLLIIHNVRWRSDKYTEFTKALFEKTVSKHFVLLNKPRNSNGDICVYNIVCLYKFLANLHPKKYETVVNIKVWPQSFYIFVKDETCVDMWLKIKGIDVENSKCSIFVANNHDGVHICFLQSPAHRIKLC